DSCRRVNAIVLIVEIRLSIISIGKGQLRISLSPRPERCTCRNFDRDRESVSPDLCEHDRAVSDGTPRSGWPRRLTASSRPDRRDFVPVTIRCRRITDLVKHQQLACLPCGCARERRVRARDIAGNSDAWCRAGKAGRLRDRYERLTRYEVEDQ